MTKIFVIPATASWLSKVFFSYFKTVNYESINVTYNILSCLQSFISVDWTAQNSSYI